MRGGTRREALARREAGEPLVEIARAYAVSHSNHFAAESGIDRKRTALGVPPKIPRPRAAISVGVVGHRPNRLPSDPTGSLSLAVSRALGLIKAAVDSARARHADVFAHDPPILDLVTALAEGSDRIGAEAGVEQGYRLNVALPFEPATYERDFPTEDSRKAFRDLLDRAANVLVLPGERAQPEAAYEMAGRAVIDNADIIVAVWDGGPSGGRGGTKEMIDLALSRGHPVLVIDPGGGQSMRVAERGKPGVGLRSPGSTAGASDDMLTSIVHRLVRPPDDAAEAAKLARFLSETWKRRSWRPEFPLLMALAGVRRMRGSDVSLPDPDAVAAKMYESDERPVGKDGPERLTVLRAFAWTDGLAQRYAQMFRSAYIANFVLAALAIVTAAASIVGTSVAHWPKWPFVLAEIVFIVAIIANTSSGRRSAWRDRWLESRRAAEELRAALLLWLVGIKSTAGDDSSWAGWYARANGRMLGLRDANMDAAGLDDTAATIAATVNDQIAYHAANERRMHLLDHRLEKIGAAFFFTTLLVAVAYVAGVFLSLHLPHGWPYLVTALTVGLPAIGAAAFGIRMIGDFADSARRSHAARLALTEVAARLSSTSGRWSDVQAAAVAASDAMLGDVERWRVAAKARELELPG